MSRKFIATVVIAALGVTAFGNAPARADEDVARVLATIVGAAIIGKIINDQVRDDDDDDFDDIATRRYDQGNWSSSPRSDRVIRRVEPRPLPRRVKRKLLPGACLRSFNTREGRYRVFGKTCLKKNYAFHRSLPRACEVKFRANKKKRRGYDARCLRRNGYQLARW